jgi:hypothetical protein
MVNINLSSHTNTANSFSLSGVVNPVCSYALGIRGIGDQPVASLSTYTGQWKYSKKCNIHAPMRIRTHNAGVTGIYGIPDIRKMRLKRMDMQGTLRAVNVFLHLPAILERLQDFKHFMISLVSVRHVILCCIFIDKDVFIFDQGCIFLVRNKNHDFKMLCYPWSLVM